MYQLLLGRIRQPSQQIRHLSRGRDNCRIGYQYSSPWGAAALASAAPVRHAFQKLFRVVLSHARTKSIKSLAVV